ncbi:tyrosine-type recombinase/integrase [Campylobacter sp.]|uniref:tyrosine-type recombinase/integrase n=1 Tax=Campylobacter sp. TaxID=205 RepID=UPI002AA83696|nr:tyrosine-type recombinase/integrase [Campylobacter sp.]MCI7581591.1 tyrosine-type recombinase/integrase [Campylobacter sp.]
MANISKANLLDKDIRLLEFIGKDYKKVVGNPKELYICVYEKTKMKTFSLYYNKHYIKIKEFREGIYSVAEARKDATKLLKELESGKDIATIKGKNDKYLFKNLFELHIAQKQKRGLKDSYLKKINDMAQKYLMPSLASRDAKSIKYSELLAIFNAIYNPKNPKQSRLETIHRLINELNAVFKIALKDRYIEHNPSDGLHDEFPTSSRFNLDNELDTRYPALTDESDIKEFISDLKSDNKLDLQTKRALYLQILCGNRPINTASAKWSDIVLNNGIWTIKATEMKAKSEHKIPLSSYALKVLKEQRIFSANSEFVFPADTIAGHLHRDSISKAIRNLGGKDKYNGRATSHGFRATFRTVCSLHKAELLQMGISEEAIESILAHKEYNPVKFSYEREKATMEQKHKLLEWYGEYLNSIEPLF